MQIWNEVLIAHLMDKDWLAKFISHMFYPIETFGVSWSKSKSFIFKFSTVFHGLLRLNPPSFGDFSS